MIRRLHRLAAELGAVLGGRRAPGPDAGAAQPTCPVCSQAVDPGQPVAVGVDGRLYHPGCVG